MRCRKCDRRAVFNMRHHKLALCEEHYPPWFVQQTARALHKYRMIPPDAPVLVAISGGKDSLALWDVLLKLGYCADGVYIDLGIDEGTCYSARSRDKAVAFARRHPEARLTVVDVRERYGETMPRVATRRRRARRICSICGVIKRHEMNRVAVEQGYAALATGHNLDDETATLFGNVLHWQMGYLIRQGPVLPADAPGWARKIKPFCRFYERETAAYVLLEGIDYIYDECPHAAGATSLDHKATLNQMEHASPGTKLHFYTNFLRAKAEGLFREPDTEVTLHPCVQCGQPTSAEGLCAFCRLWQPTHPKKGAE